MAKKKVLVCDDEEVALNLLREYLEKMDFQVGVCEDGLSAFNLIKVNDYNLIILDIVMPKMTGLEVIRKMEDIGLSTPVIVISGYSHSKEYFYGMIPDGTSLLQKPFSEKDLKEEVKKIGI